MRPEEASSARTRPSLLNRLKSGDDTESWKEFYRVYGKLVRDFAIRAGLTDTEADEAVQETAIAVARHLAEFHYDPKVCRFKTWLLNQASWRIKDQLRKRARGAVPLAGIQPLSHPKDQTGTTAIPAAELVPDTTIPELDVLFENAWRRNLLAQALDRVREKFSPKQFQIYDLYVLKEWAASDVAQSLGVTLANVYVTKHRLARAVRAELNALEAGPGYVEWSP